MWLGGQRRVKNEPNACHTREVPGLYLSTAGRSEGVYRKDVCLMALSYGYQPLPHEAGIEPRGKGQGSSQFGEGTSVERRGVA